MVKVRNELFNKLSGLNAEDRDRLLYRLFGLMETREENSQSLTSEEFFELIQKW